MEYCVVKSLTRIKLQDSVAKNNRKGIDIFLRNIASIYMIIYMQFKCNV